YRVRRALGENAILFQNSHYFIDPDIDIWCDAQELESLVKQARLLPLNDARTEDLWRRASELYRGEFLPWLDSGWIAPLRVSLRENFLEALIGLGQCARARKDYRDAIRTFHNALEHEPYREDIHRTIMLCYAEQGEKQKILKHLHTLQRLLRQELGIEPSPET